MGPDPHAKIRVNAVNGRIGAFCPYCARRHDRPIDRDPRPVLVPCSCGALLAIFNEITMPAQRGLLELMFASPAAIEGDR
jgi:hypothetical protein